MKTSLRIEPPEAFQEEHCPYPGGQMRPTKGRIRGLISVSIASAASVLVLVGASGISGASTRERPHVEAPSKGAVVYPEVHPESAGVGDSPDPSPPVASVHGAAEARLEALLVGLRPAGRDRAPSPGRGIEGDLGAPSAERSSREPPAGDGDASTRWPSGPPHGWAPYTGPFGLAEAAHLLRRTLIGPQFSEMQDAAEAGLGSTLDALLGRHDVPPPGSWTHEPVPDWNVLTRAQRDSVFAVYFGRQQDLRLWWTVQVVQSPPDLTETLTLFWHDHFATSMRDVIVPQSMYIQQDLIRKHASGNFRDMLGAMARDPAMLIWLDGGTNVASNPNENFARELFELFTLGEGSGYTQDDVREAARALTGWATDGITSRFVPNRHDGGVKTILGQTGRFGTAEVIDILLGQPETAIHISGKLYRWFLQAEPAPEDLEGLASILRESDYEIAPVLRTILSSEAFFDSAYRGALVKDGADVYCGVLRSFGVQQYDPFSYPVQARFVLLQMEDYGQLLFDPPNVAGWPGHLNWINTQTLPKRKLHTDALLSGRFGRFPLSMGIKVIDVARSFRDPNDPYAVVDDLATLWFGQAPTELVRQTMLETLLQGADPYDWSIDLPDARKRLEDLFRFVVRLPEGQLK